MPKKYQTVEEREAAKRLSQRRSYYKRKGLSKEEIETKLKQPAKKRKRANNGGERAKVRSAFGKLRRKGYFARMNYECCSSCAWASIPEDKTEKVIFYNQQSEDVWKDGKIMGMLYLQWAGDKGEIAEVFQECGLIVNVPEDTSNAFAIVGKA